MQKVVKILSVLVLFVLFSQNAQAQCAMCKAIAETSQQSGSSIADGLNVGIVYLMFFPYLLMGVVGYALYRNKKAKKVQG
jgi:hypothetical protein